MRFGPVLTSAILVAVLDMLADAPGYITGKLQGEARGEDCAAFGGQGSVVRWRWGLGLWWR